MQDKLLYGKAGVKRIVAVEVNDGNAELFIQNEDGSIKSQIINNRYWILSHNKLSSGAVKLEGGQYFEYGYQFDKREDFENARRSWKNSDIYSIWNPKESIMTKDGICLYQDLVPTDISILSFDIETTGLNPRDKNSKIILISNTFRILGKKITKLFSFDEYKTEGEMLLAWCEWVTEMDPSIMTGFNIFGFDFNYLLNRAEKAGVNLRMGRDGSPIKQHKYPTVFRIDGSRDMEFYNIDCYGREIIDVMFLAYRYDAVAKKYDSYGLKSVIKAENLEKKNRTFYDASQIRFNYKDIEEMKKIKAYCVDDADDALALFDLMCPAYFYQCNYVPRTFQHLHLSATGAMINGMLVRSYLQDRHSIPKADPLSKLEGGISFAVPGIYRNIKKVDLKSAYPSQILRFKLFDKNKDPQGNFYNIVKYFTEQRFYYKKMGNETGEKKWKDLDASGKIFINSAFGACSTNGLNFNSPAMAAKITLETRNVIDMALLWASGHGKDYWIEKFKQAVGDSV